MSNKLEQLEEKDLSLPEDAKEVLKRFLIFCACPGHAVDGAIEIIDKSIKLTRLQTQDQAILDERKRIADYIWKHPDLDLVFLEGIGAKGLKEILDQL